MESDDASNAVLTEHSSDKPNIDYLALITTTTEGLTIGEAQQINKRRRELGLPALQEKLMREPHRLTLKGLLSPNRSIIFIKAPLIKPNKRLKTRN